MAVESLRFTVATKGNGDVIDLTARVTEVVLQSEIESGIAVVFVIGSTAGITTTEFEPGLARHDLKAAFERIAPTDGFYKHEQTWNDDNGHAHVCASLLGPSLTIPLDRRQLILGQWQQIVLIDFDTRARSRTVVVQLVGQE